MDALAQEADDAKEAYPTNTHTYIHTYIHTQDMDALAQEADDAKDAFERAHAANVALRIELDKLVADRDVATAAKDAANQRVNALRVENENLRKGLEQVQK